MGRVILICTDGSPLALDAARTCIAVLSPTKDDNLIVAMAIEPADPALAYDVSGMAGPLMTAEEFDDLAQAQQQQGRQVTSQVALALGLAPDAIQVVQGPTGESLCDLASELQASTIIIGSRGHSGIKRAVLGSVSDYVIRHAPCPVLISGPATLGGHQ
ncbi:MAG: universal stress protein [Actinomycetes bacterium]